MNESDLRQEDDVALAFSRQSPIFDTIDEENKLLLWMRKRVHKEVLEYAHAGDYMLEVNCGTGIDAVFFASKGLRVKATDNAPGMLRQMQDKITSGHLQEQLSAERWSFNQLGQLGNKPTFDYIFSNFGGLNCTDDLAGVLRQMDQLLKPGGYISLVIMPKVCIWEMLLVFKGFFKTAFRRWKRGGTVAHVEGVYFNCYYYSPAYIEKHLGPAYRTQRIKGLSVAVPPPYIEHFIERHPKAFNVLERWENKWCNRAPFNRWGDHFIITLQKSAQQ